jgi:hypothetical protein
MTEADAVVGAVTETTVFLSHFEDLPDYRKRRRTPLCEFAERSIAIDWRNRLQSAVATDCNLMGEWNRHGGGQAAIHI